MYHRHPGIIACMGLSVSHAACMAGVWWRGGWSWGLAALFAPHPESGKAERVSRAYLRGICNADR